ncbi:MAG: DJ-1/PfpI family protein, partial [Pleurocapsa sp.]
MTKQINVGFLIYPGVVQLDVMGAFQVLAFPPDSIILFIWYTLDPITCIDCLIITPTSTLVDCR